MASPAPTDRSVTGYCDRLTYYQGDEVEVKAAGRGPVQASLVRLHRPPDDPTWPEPLYSPVDTVAPVSFDAGPQEVCRGSYLLVDGPAAEPIVTAPALTVSVYFQPTRPESGHPQVLLSTMDGTAGTGMAVLVDDAGDLQLVWGRGPGAPLGRLTSTQPLLRRYWHVVSAAVGDGTASLAQRPVLAVPGGLGTWSGTAEAGDAAVASSGPVLLGAGRLPGLTQGHRYPGEPSLETGLNGRLERPVLLAAAGDEAAIADLTPEAAQTKSTVLAAWDFSQGQSGPEVLDGSGHARHGRLVNTPARGVRGVTWTGDVHDWTKAPDQYGAVHFHDDDLDDCHWPTVATLRLPADLRPAVYAVRLTERGGSDEDLVPLVVCPAPANEGRADVLLVLPTFTYLAYANLLGNGEKIDYIAAGLAAGPAKEYPEHRRLTDWQEVAGSLYDVHADDSGRMYSSPRRPILNCRPTWKSGHRDAYRHLAADLYLVAWLEKLGVSFDVVTDRVVHQRGAELVRRYPVVVTGSHPEYISKEIIDAYTDHLGAGGSLLYMGGNGFYWVTSETGTVPEQIELRRGYTGTRTWTSAPGECYHSSTGELGGLWKYRGTPPNALVGVGLSAQGADGGAAPYDRHPASYDGPAAWLFDGVKVDVIGEKGYDMGAAAGDEVDRFDPANGSPPWGIVLASSQPLSEYYKLAIEEIQMTREHTGGDHEPGVRADLVLVEQASGGFVFSTGSISWLQSMAVDHFESDTARVTENALRGALSRGSRR